MMEDLRHNERAYQIDKPSRCAGCVMKWRVRLYVFQLFEVAVGAYFELKC